MATRNFIDVKDRKYFIKKSMTAFSSVLELIKDMLVKQEKIFNTEFKPVEKSSEPSPDKDKLSFVLKSTGIIKTLYILVQSIGEDNSKEISPSLVEETIDGENKTIKTLLVFDKNALGDDEIDVQNWENSKYFSSTVSEFIEKYFEETFGIKTKVESIKYIKPEGTSEKKVKYLKKHLGKVKIK